MNHDEKLREVAGPAGRRGASEAIGVIAGRAAGAAPRLGPVRLVGIDGPAGSGKTTLAGAVASGGTPLEELRRSGPDLLAGDAGELAGLLEARGLI